MTRDLRRYASQTNVRLIIGFLLLLFIVGDGLIYVFIGHSAALMGLLCMLAGLAPIVLILAALWIIDLIARQNNKN